MPDPNEEIYYAGRWIEVSERIDTLGIYRWIVDLAGIKLGDNVCDVGCGSGRTLLRVCEVTNPDSSLILGVDKNRVLLDITKASMKKKGYKVNYQHNLKVFIPIKLRDNFTGTTSEIGIKDFDNSSTTLVKGKINLIAGNYQFSDFGYVAGHEFDKILMTFLGQLTSEHPFEEVAKILEKFSKYMKKNSTFLYFDRFCLTNESRLDDLSKLILDRAKDFKLENSGFEENIENYATTIHPLINTLDVLRDYKSRESPGKYKRYIGTSSLQDFVDFLTEFSFDNDYSMGLYFLKLRKV